MNSEWVLPGLTITPGWFGVERTIQDALVAYFQKKYPHARVERECNWPVGRPDIVVTTDVIPGFRTVAIIEIKRDRASRSTVRQVSRYYWHRVHLAESEPGHTEVVTILAAPTLSPAVELSPWIMFLPLREADPRATYSVRP